ncbi:MAG: hypothetical protein LBF40_09525 [Deltaproteobacteria bacterium]|jgi:hypothetical protein|nr:hypothetical protein [Deltaproteobacteria bacterium]
MAEANDNTKNRPNGRKIRWGILWLILAAFAVSLASGCLFVMDKPFLKEGQAESGVIPDVAGIWANEEIRQTYTITKTEFSNTFKVTDVDTEDVLLATLERLEDNLFIVQLRPNDKDKDEDRDKDEDKDKEVRFTISVAEVSPNRIVLYVFQKDLKDNITALLELAEANGVTIAKAEDYDTPINMHITDYKTEQGLIAFFRELPGLTWRGDFVLTRK